MGTVTDIESRLRPGQMGGDALCIECGAKWNAKAPIGTRELECPHCGSMKGIWRWPTHGIKMGEPLWSCNCGNIHMTIGATAVYCSCCGLKQDLGSPMPDDGGDEK